MKIRMYQESDCQATLDLLYNTVHQVNIKDYNLAQVNAWAPKNKDPHKWNESLLKNYALVIEEDDEIIAFGDIEESGYLDRFYIHHLWQHKGIGKLLLGALEAYVESDITTHASITAQGFFERYGYVTLKRQVVEVNNVTMENFVMLKRR